MRSFAALLVAATLAALTGCSTPEPPPPVVSPSASASASATPVFASDEEALAAAEKAYTEYLATVDAVLNAGGKGAEMINDVASRDALQAGVSDAEEFARERVKTIGVRTVANLVLQSFDDERVRLYICEDVSAVNLLGANGESLVSSTRPPRQAFEVAVDSESLLVTERWARDNEGVCP
jgi:hypothetical protein